MSTPKSQIEAIQSMLTAGHRNVHLERHSLLLIGGVGGFICLVSEWIISEERFPDPGQRGIALLLWLAFWLGGTSLLEYRITRRARTRRLESLPFAQAQLTRAWWMLLTIGSLGSFAMFFHGGGGMIYALWTVLLGLGIYFYGLFSRPLLEWIGLATILLGVTGLAAGLPYGTTRWLSASCFAIGMPLAGWLVSHMNEAGLTRRAFALGLWLVAVVTPALLLPLFAPTATPSAIPLPLNSAIGPGEQVVRLPAGTQIPLRVDLESPILSIQPQAELKMTLALPVEIALNDGHPDGRYRIGNGNWHLIHNGILRLRIDRLKPIISIEGAEVRAHAQFISSEFKGDAP